MEEQALTPDVLKALRATQPYPVLSLTMPTHHRPDHAQDPVRLRNLVAEAVKRLDGDPEVPRDARMALKAQLERAAAEADLRGSDQGMVLFVNGQGSEVWHLPRWVPERVVFSDSYLTRNLVAAKAQAAPFWLVVVSAEKAELWRGVDGVLHPHTDQGFPLTPEPVQSDPERLERIGDTPSVYQDETTRGFLRRVEDAVAKLLNEEPLPYFLVGPAAALSLLEHRAGKGQQPVGRLAKAGLVGATPPVLAEEIKPMLAEYGQRRTKEVLDRLDQAIGRKTFGAGLDEIWESVSTGRVELLAVEEDFRLTARMDQGHLVPLLDGEVGPDVREDVVDEIVETALNTDAEVVFVPNGTLDQHQHMAAVLRY